MFAADIHTEYSKKVHTKIIECSSNAIVTICHKHNNSNNNNNNDRLFWFVIIECNKDLEMNFEICLAKTYTYTL